MPIRRLPPEVAAKIAAGEVVERPASVVKELVENSIDAGAGEIQVEIREGGRRLIRVADDGCGVPADEAGLAFARHSTSKLTDVSDLDQITTLGFRGEALASIAAVSQVTLLTRPRDQAMGAFLRVEDGRVVREEGRGSPAGTTITVEHLFHSVPARLKFLRQPRTEAGHIHEVVTHYALAYPAVRFRLTVDGRQIFQSTGAGSLYDVLIAVHGLELAADMLALEELAEDDRVVVSGYTGAPVLHRANRSYITLFVNRRWIQDTSLAHAVAQAYHGLLPVGRHPVAVVLVDVDPAEVDVNVHPTKREVKFRDGRRVFSAVQRAVRHTLVDRAPVPAAGGRGLTWDTRWPVPGDTAPHWGDPDALRTWERRQAMARLGQGDAQAALDLYRPPEDEPQPGYVGPVRLPLLRVVGQVGQTYVVAEGPQGMYLVDQHAAHERVLYEKMSADSKRQAVASQALLEPEVLDLDPILAGILDEQVAGLNHLGFEIEPFGGAAYLLRAVPAILSGPNVRAALVDILEMLRDGDDPLADQAEERLVAIVCKRAAVKAGQTLSQAEMQQLIRDLEQCESPRTCPHGRPTVVHFTIETLEKEFLRR
ncbi:MAG TPA: DNA mismatch repair endonuclease MutL [Anaerolineae bacterium]|nr:DNA mismatch repair endonuclease MutL [Anaerolineae bacterium]